MIASRNGLNGQTLRKQYKERISGYRTWGQLGHAEEYMLFPDNFGADLSLDETCLSNGEVYTILTNKAAHGGKGALAAMIRGVASDTVVAVLRRVPYEIRQKVSAYQGREGPCRGMGAGKDGERGDKAADHGTQPPYNPDAQVKVERPATGEGGNTLPHVPPP